MSKDDILAAALRALRNSADAGARRMGQQLAERADAELVAARASAGREVERAKHKPLPYLLAFLAGALVATFAAWL